MNTFEVRYRNHPRFLLWHCNELSDQKAEDTAINEILEEIPGGWRFEGLSFFDCKDLKYLRRMLVSMDTETMEKRKKILFCGTIQAYATLGELFQTGRFMDLFQKNIYGNDMDITSPLTGNVFLSIRKKCYETWQTYLDRVEVLFDIKD